MSCPSNVGVIAGICTNTSLFRFPLWHLPKLNLRILSWPQRICFINRWSRTWKMATQIATTLVQRPLLSTQMHCHLPDSRSSVALCCIILSMHFSCSRLMIQCSGSEVTWETEEQRQPAVQHLCFLRHFFSLQNQKNGDIRKIMIKAWPKRVFFQFWYLKE